MDFCANDREYMNIVNDILNNEEFNKIKEIEHHGITRYEHSIKVSYYSYKISKRLGLDYTKTARAGLLHDFFMSENDRTKLERFTSTFIHPKFAVSNAEEIFGIDKKEYDIIRTHMFPINIAIPKYAESWVVSGVDKFVATNEFGKKYKNKFKYVFNLFIIFLINSIR